MKNPLPLTVGEGLILTKDIPVSRATIGCLKNSSG